MPIILKYPSEFGLHIFDRESPFGYGYVPGKAIPFGLALLPVDRHALQGVTPDAQDLASLNSLRVLCQALADFE